MSKEIIIGKEGDQGFVIPNSCGYVHRQHAKYTVDDNGNRYIEDIHGESGNGIYIRDENGNFVRIYKRRVEPTDVVRLGPYDAKSFTFMVHRLENPNSIDEEFNYLRKLNKDFDKKEAEQLAINKRHNLITIIVPAVCAVLGFSLRMFVKMDMITLMGIISLASAIPIAILRVMFRDDNEKLKAIKEHRKKMFICPNGCGRTLSEEEVRSGRCNGCKNLPLKK